MFRQFTRIAQTLFNSPWAIQEEWLKEMYSILVNRESAEAYKALMVKEGTPLEYSYKATRRGSVAILPIQGPIFPKANLMTSFSGATSLEMVAQDLAQLDEDESVEHIVFPMDTPGGVTTGLDEFVALLQNCKTPTYGHGSGMVASAGYWLMSNMKHVSISPTTSVGSIGVMMSMTKYRKEGKKNEYPKTLKFISSVSPRKNMDPETDEGSKEIYSVVNKIAEVFIADVAAGRGVSPEDVLQSFGKGGMITGDLAVAAGMVDRIDTLEALIARLGEPEYSSHGDYQMNKKEYALKHPDEYAAIRAEGHAEGKTEGSTEQETVVVELQSTNDNLQQENKDLTIKLDKAEATNEVTEDRIKKLEKKTAIQDEVAIKSAAEGIFDKELAASTVPERFHEKIRAFVDHDKFVAEGVFDKEGYTAAVKAEVKDWSTKLGATTESNTLAGFGTAGEEAEHGEAEAKVDATVDSMLGHLNVPAN